VVNTGTFSAGDHVQPSLAVGIMSS